MHETPGIGTTEAETKKRKAMQAALRLRVCVFVFAHKYLFFSFCLPRTTVHKWTPPQASPPNNRISDGGDENDDDDDEEEGKAASVGKHVSCNAFPSSRVADAADAMITQKAKAKEFF